MVYIRYGYLEFLFGNRKAKCKCTTVTQFRKWTFFMFRRPASKPKLWGRKILDVWVYTFTCLWKPTHITHLSTILFFFPILFNLISCILLNSCQASLGRIFFTQRYSTERCRLYLCLFTYFRFVIHTQGKQTCAWLSPTGPGHCLDEEKDLKLKEREGSDLSAHLKGVLSQGESTFFVCIFFPSLL